MNLQNVVKVARKEMKETLRDRRTMIMMVLIPVFLYPVLFIFLQQLALIGQRQIEQEPVTIGVSGASAETVRFLEGDTALRIVAAPGDPIAAVREGELDAAVRMEGAGVEELGSETARVLYDASRDRSRRAEDLLQDRLAEWGDTLLAARLEEQRLPGSFAAPVVVRDSSVASGERMGGYALGRFLPLILMLMTLLGTFFPSIDLTAGEKERGTLETLLTSPVPNRDIVAGKFLTIVIIAIVAAGLNLASMLLTVQSGVFQFEQAGNFDFRLPAGTVALVLLMLIPLAVLFAALFMGIAVRAHSFKEAQNALTPVQIGSMIPMYLPLIPGIEFTYAVAMVPIGGLALLFRDLMAGNAPLGPSVTAVGATILYAAFALRFAARAFGREEVLFGSGTEAASPVTWKDRLAEWRMAAHQVPRPAHALLLVGVAGLLYFYVGMRLRFGGDIVQGLFTSQWLLMALPAVLFVVAGRYRARETLALRAPAPRALLAAVLIILGAMPISWLLGWIQMRFIEVPEEFLKAFETLLTADTPGRLVWLLVVIAVTPAICEELVFRGVLLQGLGAELTKWRAVAGSALVFGAFHLSYETFVRFLPTAWLGLLLGYVVWESRSIFTGMLMHFVNNATALVVVASTGLQSYVTGPGGEPRWYLVGSGLLLLAAGLRLLPKRADANALSAP